MIRWSRLVPFAVLTPIVVGCSAPILIQPGLSAIRVRIDAKPKAGYREPQSNAYSPSDAPVNAGAFRRVNYRALSEIVVFATPAEVGTDRPAAPEVLVELGRLRTTRLYATGTGGALRVRNTGATPETVYSVSVDNEFDLGEIAAGGEATWRFANAGIVEIWSTRRADPIATVYVAPTPWVRLVSSGSVIAFSDLPPGPCRVTCWHSRLPGATTMVELVPDRVSSTRLELGVDSLPVVP